MSIGTKKDTGPAVAAAVRAYTVSQLAERYVVKPHLILALIAIGDLKAINVAAPGAKRPHWRILA